jgi:DNA-binding transcriptional LysR family regulator
MPLSQARTPGRAKAFGDDRSLARQLRKLNLDLLPILHELLKTKSVSQTAQALGVTQPAISRALRELRAVFEDELIVSLGRDAQLTERAAAMAEPLQRVLQEIRELTRPGDGFDPTRETLRVVIGTADYVAAVLAPYLTALCAETAPFVRFDFVDTTVEGPQELARYDFLIAPRGYGETLGKRIPSVHLWHDHYVCIAGASNHSIPDRLSEDDFRRVRHVGFQPRLDMPATVGALILPPSTLEETRVCTVSSFLALGAIVEASDCVALIPRKLAETLARWGAVRLIELDYAETRVDADLYWAPGVAGRHGHKWALDTIIKAAERVRRDLA